MVPRFNPEPAAGDVAWPRSWPWPRSPVGSTRPLPKGKKSIGKTMFCDMGIPTSQNIIEPVVYEGIHCYFDEKGAEMIGKALSL